MSSFDLKAYCQRIDYSGELTPTLKTLRALHHLHPQSIPFENLNPLLKWPVRLDLSAIEQKMIRTKRGGYCFEQNLLFGTVLRAIGFSVKNLAARVLWNHPEGAITAQTHMLLRIDLHGNSYIADVGFGGQTLTAPLMLKPDIEQTTPHDPFRLLQIGEEFLLQSDIKGEWKSLYRFDLRETPSIDYEVGNWYVSTHPESRFVNRLVAARTTPDRRYTLNNNEFTIHFLNGPSERRILTDPKELGEILTSVFGLALPDVPEMEGILFRFVAPAS